MILGLFPFEALLFNLLFPLVLRKFTLPWGYFGTKGTQVVLATLGPGLCKGRRMAKMTFQHCRLQSEDAKRGYKRKE